MCVFACVLERKGQRERDGESKSVLLQAVHFCMKQLAIWLGSRKIKCTDTHTHHQHHKPCVPVATALTSKGVFAVSVKPCPVLLSKTGSLVICSVNLAWKY